MQNLLLVPFLVLITYSYHRNEIFLVQNLLLLPFGFDSKKLEKNVWCCVWASCCRLCISIFYVVCKIKISRSKYLFLWCLFNYKKGLKRVPNGVYRNEGFFLLWDSYESAPDRLLLYYYHVCKNGCIWNPATCSCKNGKYLVSIIEDSVITCDEIIERTKTTTKKKKCSNKKFFNNFLYFTRLFINYHSIIDSC